MLFRASNFCGAPSFFAYYPTQPEDSACAIEIASIEEAWLALGWTGNHKLPAINCGMPPKSYEDWATLPDYAWPILRRAAKIGETLLKGIRILPVPLQAYPAMIQVLGTKKPVYSPSFTAEVESTLTSRALQQNYAAACSSRLTRPVFLNITVTSNFSDHELHRALLQEATQFV